MAVWGSAKQGGRSPHSHRWLAEAVFALDRWLRRRLAVVEYTSHPSCVFRLDIARSRRQVALRDGTRLRAGQRIARLHLWSEHIPPIAPNGATIGWARQMRQSMVTSLRELAHYLSSRPELRDIAVICADAPSGTQAQSQQLARIMAYYGFEVIAENDRLLIRERIHRFGENILISLIVFAHNPSALRLDSLRRVRVPIFISRRALEERFGGAPRPPAPAREGAQLPEPAGAPWRVPT